MLIKLIVVSNLLFLLIGCNQSGLSRDAKEVYDNRVELIKEFNNITIWKRGDSAFLLQLYKEDSINSYLFRGDKGLKLQGDTIQFELREIERFKDVDTLNQNDKVRGLLTELLNKMEALRIREVSSDRMRLGINLEFFLRKGGVVFFVRDLSAVTNPVWQSYIKESTMMDVNWYYNGSNKYKKHNEKPGHAGLCCYNAVMSYEAICCNCFFTMKASISFLTTVLSSSVNCSTSLNCCRSSASLREAFTFSSLSPLTR